MAANQETTVQDAVSSFISVNLLDIFNKTLAHFPAMFVATNPNTGVLREEDDHPPHGAPMFLINVANVPSQMPLW